MNVSIYYLFLIALVIIQSHAYLNHPIRCRVIYILILRSEKLYRGLYCIWIVNSFSLSDSKLYNFYNSQEACVWISTWYSLRRILFWKIGAYKWRCKRIVSPFSFDIPQNVCALLQKADLIKLGAYCFFLYNSQSFTCLRGISAM